MTGSAVILGAGDAALAAAALCERCGVPVAGLLDDDLELGASVHGYVVLGRLREATRIRWIATHRFVVALSDPADRRRWIRRMAEAGGELITVDVDATASALPASS